MWEINKILSLGHPGNRIERAQYNPTLYQNKVNKVSGHIIKRWIQNKKDCKWGSLAFSYHVKANNGMVSICT